MSEGRIRQRNADKVFARHKIPDEKKSYRQGDRDPALINKLIEEIQLRMIWQGFIGD
jgi:hypothetical protein